MRTMVRLALAALLAAAACSTDRSEKDGRLRVEAGFYPLAYVAERVGGPAVTVDNLTPAGAEPHDLELTATQVADIRDADLVIYLKRLQPAVDSAVQGANALDLAAPGEDDPHVWLDPVRMQLLVGTARERLVQLRPKDRAGIELRAETLRQELVVLDQEFKGGLARCSRRELVTSHTAFGHLARRYQLTQVGITGVSPDAEPSPRRLAEIVTFVRERHVTTIFFERLVSPKLAQTIASETHATTAVLSPLEALAPGEHDYFSVMRANLAALRTALGCT